MRTKKLWMSLVFVMLVAMTLVPLATACTIVGVGNKASTDGSAMVTHNDDSGVADFRLYIKPGGDFEPGTTRDIVYDSHNYVGGTVVGEMPQAAHTYSYFRSRYSFINEKGVAMGESTFSYTRDTPLRTDIYNTLVRNSTGLIDCWFAQDIALERATTAREAVQIMGALVEKYGWVDAGETMNITDGNELWIAEFYGKGLWAAVRIPNDHVTVAANRARIGEINLLDKENYMASPDIYSFAIDKGWYDPASGKPFRLYEVYGPCDSSGCYLREWRILDLVAPSMKFDSKVAGWRWPLSVKPDKLLSVIDVFNLKGDYYQGTEYDITKVAQNAAGPWGDIYTGQGGRPINVRQTCYLQISQIKPWLPDGVKALVWYGYGGPATAYLTPLWPVMTTLPAFYQKGTRYETFQRDSGWWVSIYVQEMSRLKFDSAIKDIKAVRDPRMERLTTLVPAIQDLAASLYKTDKKAAFDVLQQFAYSNAVEGFNTWLALGDFLLGKYAMGYVNFSTANYPTWYRDYVGYTAGVKKAPTN